MPKTKTNVPHRVPPYRRPIFIAGFIVIVLLIATVVFCITSSRKPQLENDDSKKEDSNSATENKPSSEDNTIPDQPDEPDQRPPQYEGQDPNTLDNLTGHIAYRSINPDNNTMTLMISIDQYINTSGECSLSLKTNGQEVYSDSLPATADVTTSVCGPFEIPISDFSPGLYQLEITISADDKSGTIIDEVQL